MCKLNFQTWRVKESGEDNLMKFYIMSLPSTHIYIDVYIWRLYLKPTLRACGCLMWPGDGGLGGWRCLVLCLLPSMLLLVPIPKAVMLTQLLRISYDVIRRSLVSKWKYAILIPISVSASAFVLGFPRVFPALFVRQKLLPGESSGAALGKWSKIKLNYGNWKWKAKIKRIMSGKQGGGRTQARAMFSQAFPLPKIKATSDEDEDDDNTG